MTEKVKNKTERRNTDTEENRNLRVIQQAFVVSAIYGTKNRTPK
jgi:hypothetical protein